MSGVVLKYCAEYDFQKIGNTLRESFSLLNFDIRGAVSGKKVLLKPNMLGAYSPEKAVTTHPAFIEALIRILKDFDCELMLGDSPNGAQKSLEEVWEVTGIGSICRRYGVSARPFEKSGAVKVGDLWISNVVMEADYIINLPKFKTHGLTVLTGAVKNMFGIVPGLKKAAVHRDSPEKSTFAKSLVGIAEVKKPDLNIVDGIVSMAGNGPSGGDPLNLGLVAIGKDMHEVDLALAGLVNVDPHHVETLDEAEKMGLVDLKKFPTLLGDSISIFDVSNFKLPVSYTTNLRNFKWFNFLINKFMDKINVRPRVIKERCVRCGMCVKICPVRGIKFSGDLPVFDYEMCIGCFCCHEVCPENAVELRESIALKIFKFFSRVRH